MDPDELDDILKASDKFIHLLESLSDILRDPVLALRIPSLHPMSWLGLLSHIMLASPDLKPMSEKVPHDLSSASSTIPASIERVGGRIVLALDLFGATRPFSLQHYDFTWNVLLEIMRFVSARTTLVPVSVSYTAPRPVFAHAYFEQFGCPMHFDAVRNTMEFAADAFIAPLSSNNPPALECLFRLLDVQQPRAPAPSTSSRVKDLLLSMIDRGRPIRGSVSRNFAISERTLQRRLADEGTTFSTLIDEVRRELTGKYMDEKLPIKTVQYKLGFSTPSPFNRACLRLFGKTPSEIKLERSLQTQRD